MAKGSDNGNDRFVEDADNGSGDESLPLNLPPSREAMVSEDQKELLDRKEAIRKAVESLDEPVYATGSQEGKDFVVVGESPENGLRAYTVSKTGKTKEIAVEDVFYRTDDEEA